MRCLFDVGLPADDLKNIETYCSISRLYVEVYMLTLVHLLLLSIKFFTNARI